MASHPTFTTLQTEQPAQPSLAFAAGIFFALRSIISLAAISLLGVAPETASAIRVLLTFLLLILVLLSVLTGPAGIPQTTPLSAPIRWTFAYLAFAACSLLWTESASPAASAVYLLGTGADVGIAILFTRGLLARSNTLSITRGFLVGALIVAGVAWLMPAQSDLRLGNEDYFNSNTIAYICCFGVFFAQLLNRSTSGPRYTFPSAFLVLTIFRSLSKTTILAFLLGEAFILARDRSITRRAKIFLICSVATLLLLFSGLYVAYYDVYTSTGNQAETLTGRTAIWSWSFEAASQCPWFGHGFDSMWKVAPRFGTFEARHAENETLQQFYSLGAVGVFLFVLIYTSLWRAAGTIERSRQTILRGIILFIAIRGLAEAEPFDLLLPLWMVVMLTRFIDELQPALARCFPALNVSTANVSPS